MAREQSASHANLEVRAAEMCTSHVVALFICQDRATGRLRRRIPLGSSIQSTAPLAAFAHAASYPVSLKHLDSHLEHY